MKAGIEIFDKNGKMIMSGKDCLTRLYGSFIIDSWSGSVELNIPKDDNGKIFFVLEKKYAFQRYTTWGTAVRTKDIFKVVGHKLEWERFNITGDGYLTNITVYYGTYSKGV